MITNRNYIVDLISTATLDIWLDLSQSFVFACDSLRGVSCVWFHLLLCAQRAEALSSTMGQLLLLLKCNGGSDLLLHNFLFTRLVALSCFVTAILAYRHASLARLERQLLGL